MEQQSRQQQQSLIGAAFRIINPKIVFATVGLVLVSIAVGIILFLVDQHQAKATYKADSTRYFQAMDMLSKAQNNPAEDSDLKKQAVAILESLTTSRSKGVKLYSMMRLGDLDAQAGKYDDAIKSWKAVNYSTPPSAPLHTFTHYMVLNVEMQQLAAHPDQFTGAQIKSMRDGFKSIIKANNVWKGLAQEGLVALDLQSKDPAIQAEGQKLLKDLAVSAHPDNSAELRRRSNLLLSAVPPAPSIGQ